MKYYDIGAIEDGFELPVGARFRFRDTLFEVVEANEGRTNPWGCSKCAFNKEGMEEVCLIMKCDGYDDCRQDKKYIYFKEVEETKESGDGVTAKAECCSREKTAASGTQLQRQDLQQILQL